MKASSRLAQARNIVFIAVMGALANILSAISITLGSIAPSVGIDLSHVGIFTASIYGGPIIGAITGFIGGVVPGLIFTWGGFGIIFLPLGKAIAGFFTGLLSYYAKPLERRRTSLLTVLVVLLGYIPESIYTYLFFVWIVPTLIPSLVNLAQMIMFTVLFKAWVEILIISFLMGALSGNSGFSTFVHKYFTSYKV
ncbi:MAG: ECF transporter S component [Candidatus Bathyarchaeia archaeon]